MKSVLEGLKAIEAQHDVEVLFAVEAGSRVWGFASQDSDYDVRFIYMHKPDKYLSICEWRDVIEKTDGELDFSGWDIRKALRLMNNYNPPIREWFSSPTVYKTTKHGAILADTGKDLYSPRACAYHYYHMARGNYRDCLQGDPVWLKKYLYVVRPLLAILHIEQKGFPPLDINTLAAAVSVPMPVLCALAELVSLKKRGKETDYGPRIEVLNTWIEEQLYRNSGGFDKLPKTRPPTSALNACFTKIWHDRNGGEKSRQTLLAEFLVRLENQFEKTHPSV